MAPTLHTGDHLCIQMVGFFPKEGDIVVVAPEGDEGFPIIKRIIATEGQTIDIDFLTHEVWVDGELLDEPYIAEPTWRQSDVIFPLTVPEGHIFVMGDNRNISLDSRDSNVGMLDIRRVLGEAILRISPDFEWIH